ncbi:uncharacterized protein LOC105703601 [Orussus abietinus]|uniref:uncharacterized protein LOC105703601 n=1 Tax=Orussus abietinus TaxID=222816 RepID=UPI000626274F|nr:uncharacterized protein LOC105703601 [Orussus abietinus]
MPQWARVLLLGLLVGLTRSKMAGLEKLESYARFFHVGDFFGNVSTGNELWQGLMRDCSKKTTFSCIQKNAYSYLDDTFSERDNITVFDGLVLTRNNLDYASCGKKKDVKDSENVDENLVEYATEDGREKKSRNLEKDPEESGWDPEEPATPLEEITTALREKTVKFLATRDYELQLPEFFFEGATVKVSPREVDENGALLRVDFGQRGMERQGRILFKKIRKFIQNKLLMSFLSLLLVIKLIKLKFMFVIPFLFGIGTAKKLFLKLLLFLVPAFAHVFKLCSSYHSSQGAKLHHHHHQIAHHHHHVPVPVPVPAYYDHHHHHKEEEFEGYDYAHPHIQYRKDMEELKEWGIEPYEDPPEEPDRRPAPYPATPPGVSGVSYPGPYGLPQYAVHARPVVSVYPEKSSSGPPLGPHTQNVYPGYAENGPLSRRTSGPHPTAPLAMDLPLKSTLKSPYAASPQLQRPMAAQVPQPAAILKKTFDDDFYGPIMARLEEIFTQLRFVDESCRERLVCSMYKNPALYSPHSNLVSNELSRDPQELKRGVAGSASSHRFHRYLGAARLGQDGGDCLRSYPCHINTE